MRNVNCYEAVQMRTMGRRVLGRPLTSCMLAGALALSVAACGGGSKKGGGGGGGSGTSTLGAEHRRDGQRVAGDRGLRHAASGQAAPGQGGTSRSASMTGQTPTYIFPIPPSAHTTTGTITFLAQLFMPVFAGPTGAEPKVNYAQSFASGRPVPSNGDKTYTIHLKQGLKWSSGQPMDANDVLFAYYVLRAGIATAPPTGASTSRASSR